MLDKSFYTAKNLANVMSLRKPQARALEILDDILAKVDVGSDDLGAKLAAVKDGYPTLTDFEREFMSMTFALATGVGKTRLMGAFIAYLYCQHGIRNFFIVAPGTTVYEKLRADLGDPSNPKYVFKGLGCFSGPPQVISGDDYRSRQLRLQDSDINLFVFNIDKFNSENAKMRQLNEFLGTSFIEEMAGLEDLVVLMDESHHYRAKAGAKALNDLKPLFGLELTATPLVAKGAKQIPFKNVVYEYPLSEAIRDGYTRTPYALTRLNIDIKNLGEMETDKVMLTDALLFHEKIKNELRAYASDYNARLVKPFMLVVCKDTDHAERVQQYIMSDEFGHGQYKNKTIMVHSKQRGAESDDNLRLLLDVEKATNPIEIVIHVNMLKEGWDVNNLYTIVPLRTAASQILREQMIGRGLRLPFGRRTGDQVIDMVALAAHDNFEDILEKASSADSIFKAGNVIKAEALEQTYVDSAQVALSIDAETVTTDFYNETGLEKSAETDSAIQTFQQAISDIVTQTHSDHARRRTSDGGNHFQAEQVRDAVIDRIREQNTNVQNLYVDNQLALDSWITKQSVKYYEQARQKFIPIPLVKVTFSGVRRYVFHDFDLDLGEFNEAPVNNQIRVQNLQDLTDSQTLSGGQIVDIENIEPRKFLAQKIITYPSIDFIGASNLIGKLIDQVVNHYQDRYGVGETKNILVAFRNQICDRIKNQMLEHRTLESGEVREEIMGVKRENIAATATYTEKVGLFDDYNDDIRSVLFTGIRRGVFSSCKFDSRPELVLARVLESEESVVNWLRPAPAEFNITYGEGRNYEPDFVVETTDKIYLVEVKGEDKLDSADVLAKKERAVSYCRLVSDWARANGEKSWQYVFIPSKEITVTASFADNLAQRFGV